MTPVDDTRVLLGHQHRVLELLAGGAERGEVLEAVTRSLEELIPGSRCSVLVLDPVARTLHHGAAPSLPAAYSAAIDGMAIGCDAGSCGTAAHTGEAVIAEDVARDRRWVRYRDLALPHGLGSCWSSPIRLRRAERRDGDSGRAERPDDLATGAPGAPGATGATGAGDEVLGTFAVYHEAGHRPDERERRLVARFTDLAALTLEHDRLYGALAQSEERFRRAFEDNAVGMALTDLDGRFLKVNPALARMLGRDAGDLLAEDLTAVVRREDRAGARLLLRGLAGRSGPPVAFGTTGPGPLEVTLVRGDDSTLTAALTASVVGAGARRHLSLNVVDVTARRAAQRDRIARREAELAARVAEDASRAKSELLSTLSHELRTPLQAIIGFAELLGTLDLPPERRGAALGHIDSAARHVLDLVGDVLDLARLEARALPLSPAPVDPAAVMAEVTELLAPLAAERGITVRVVPDAGCGGVYCDGRRLRQVLINLVTNGVRHNHLGGWVEVAAHEDDEEIALVVRDGGPGIAPALLDRLFVPFDQLGRHDGDAGGAGLGLALVRGLVVAMSGTVGVTSTPGEGTTVTVRLPAAVDAVATGAGVRSGGG